MFKVVIVEDEALVRKGIVLTMDWAEMDCVVVGEAANGQEGLEIVRQYSPDLVITDIRMPIMDGVEMIRTLKAENTTARFIFLTAYSDFSYAYNAVKLGVSDYLLKPFVDGDLENAVRKIQKELMEERLAGENAPLLSFNREKGVKSKYVEQAVEYIRSHYNDPNMSVGQVSGYLEISESYLSRVFKKETDYTFNAYLTTYRIHTAMMLLHDCRVKVYEVAERVGYLDTTYFSTVFKKLTGYSPSDYQDRCK